MSADASLRLLGQQRSHVLFVLSQPKDGLGEVFLSWYRGSYQEAVLASKEVLTGRLYERHEVDITRGRYPLLPFQYLALYELSIDGAEGAADVIGRITGLHAAHAAARAPATWLYYPACEKVGRAPWRTPSMLTVAFANGLPGQEAEFREWYATRHIRHALHIPALVSGQCFERTLFQSAGAMEARFATIALYEQEGAPEEFLEAAGRLPKETFIFPMLDRSRFAEAVYRPL